MPFGDRTGPLGQGPMTGRRAGFCAGYNVPGYANPIPGRGYGLGRGWGGSGRGWRHWYYATGLPGWVRFGYAPAWGQPPAYSPYAPPMTAEQELQMLKNQAEWLKSELEAIDRRIQELSQES
jgi:hypothetical protein